MSVSKLCTCVRACLSMWHMLCVEDKWQGPHRSCPSHPGKTLGRTRSWNPSGGQSRVAGIQRKVNVVQGSRFKNFKFKQGRTSAFMSPHTFLCWDGNGFYDRVMIVTPNCRSCPVELGPSGRLRRPEQGTCFWFVEARKKMLPVKRDSAWRKASQWPVLCLDAAWSCVLKAWTQALRVFGVGLSVFSLPYIPR